MILCTKGTQHHLSRDNPPWGSEGNIFPPSEPTAPINIPCDSDPKTRTPTKSSNNPTFTHQKKAQSTSWLINLPKL